MLATKVSNYSVLFNFRNAGNQRLTIIVFRNAGYKCWQLDISETLETNVSNYTSQKCWLQILAIIFFKNDQKC